MSRWEPPEKLRARPLRSWVFDIGCAVYAGAASVAHFVRPDGASRCAVAGKRLFDGFGESMELEHLGVRQSPFATFIGYRVKK